MCGKGLKCQKPTAQEGCSLQKRKGKPETCSPKQVEECHGTSKTHPCLKKQTSK
jgi:hypothetical protein